MGTFSTNCLYDVHSAHDASFFSSFSYISSSIITSIKIIGR